MVSDNVWQSKKNRLVRVALQHWARDGGHPPENSDTKPTPLADGLAETFRAQQQANLISHVYRSVERWRPAISSKFELGRRCKLRWEDSGGAQ